MNKTFACVGAGTAVAGLLFATWLLKQSLVSPGIFLSLATLFIATALVIAFAPAITKVSFWSLTLELREATNAAEKVLEQLKRSVEYAFVPAIASITEFGGGWGDIEATQDERLHKFLTLAEAIEGAGCAIHHSPALAAAARVIAIGQLRKFAYFSPGATIPNLEEPLPSVDALRAQAFLPDRIAQHCKALEKTEEQLLGQLHAVIDAYAKIYPYTL